MGRSKGAFKSRLNAERSLVLDGTRFDVQKEPLGGCSFFVMMYNYILVICSNTLEKSLLFSYFATDLKTSSMHEGMTPLIITVFMVYCDYVILKRAVSHSIVAYSTKFQPKFKPTFKSNIMQKNFSNVTRLAGWRDQPTN